MPVVGPLLVCVLLFRAGVGGPSGLAVTPPSTAAVNVTTPTNISPGRSCAVIPNRRSVFTLVQSRYDAIYRGGDSLARASKARRLRTTKTLKSQFSPSEWRRIGSLPTGLTNAQDAVDRAAVAVRNVYTSTLDLLCRKVQAWLDAQDERIIAPYLGYGPRTVDLINIAITELAAQQRRNAVRIDNLLQLFYYACDADVMRENEENGTDTVRMNFAYLMKKFPLHSGENATPLSEADLVDDLTANLSLIVKRVDNPFGVTVRAMKTRILAEPQPDRGGALAAIQNRMATASSAKTVRQFVESYAKEKDGTKIREFHLSVLGVLIPHVFGYARNHFELLAELRVRGGVSSQDDRAVVEGFSTFADGFMSVFLDRFFEFRGEVGQDVLDAVFAVKRFLNPLDRQPIGGDHEADLTAEEEAAVRWLEHAEWSILDYYESGSGANVDLDYHMRGLINRAVEELLNAFVEDLDVKRRRFEMSEWPKVDYRGAGEKVRSRETVLNLMRANNASAAEILSVFSCEFTLGKDVYDRSLLDDGRSHLPLDDALVLSIQNIKS